MKLTDKDLLKIAINLLSDMEIGVVVRKINKIFEIYGIKKWGAVINHVNGIYYFNNGNLRFWDNYNRNGLDWVEYEDIIYDFTESEEKDLLKLIKNLSLKSKNTGISNIEKQIEIISEEHFKISVFEGYDFLEELKKENELTEIIKLSLKNSIKYKRVVEINKQDSLTGLYNYKEFLKILNEEIEISKTENKHLSIIFIDIDEFKQVNDKYGHLTGSKILIEFGGILLKDIRHKDCITRYGGDEYVILLRDTNKKEAVSVAKRLLNLIKSNEFKGERGDKIKITASMGVSAYPEDASDAEILIKIADDNMYKVKKDSKNGVEW